MKRLNFEKGCQDIAVIIKIFVIKIIIAVINYMRHVGDSSMIY